MRWLLLGLLWSEGSYTGWIGGTVEADLDGDGHTDRAILVLRADVADLHVFTRRGHQVGRAVAWRGRSYGQSPTLQASPTGGLILRSHNSSVGRSRWHRSVDLQWKDDGLRVIRERFVAYDAVDAEVNTDCSVDLTGADVALRQWSYERPPCTRARSPRTRTFAEEPAHASRPAAQERL